MILGKHFHNLHDRTVNIILQLQQRSQVMSPIPLVQRSSYTFSAHEGVLKQYEFETGGDAKNVGFIFAIVLVLRLMDWAALQWRR
jgi:hypothetical protein